MLRCIWVMYLGDEADYWFFELLASQGKLIREEFASLLCMRFADQSVIGIVDEFNKLQQIGSVEQYQEKFNELKAYMLIETSH